MYPSYMTSGEANKKMKAKDLPVSEKDSQTKKEGVVLIGKIFLDIGRFEF